MAHRRACPGLVIGRAVAAAAAGSSVGKGRRDALELRDVGEKDVHDGRIERPTPFGPNDLQDFIEGHRFFVGPLREHGVKAVDDAHDPGFHGDFKTFETVWVPIAVPFFVMGPRNGLSQLEEPEAAVGKALGADDGVAFHDDPLFGVKLARLEQNAVGDADFPEVVHGAGQVEKFDMILRQAAFASQQGRVLLNPANVHPGFLVPELGGEAQPEDCFVLHFIDFILFFLDFFGALRNLDLQEVVLFPQRVFRCLEPQVRPDARPNFKGGDRFRDVVDGPDGESLAERVRIGRRRDEHNGYIAKIIVGLDDSAKFEPVDLRHEEIEDDHARLF
ncbi:hypothetical protein DSECCO2_503340 [anaerobic digester metagenome]